MKNKNTSTNDIDSKIAGLKMQFVAYAIFIWVVSLFVLLVGVMANAMSIYMLAIFLILLGCLYLYVGISVKKKTTSVRILGIVLSIVAIPSFPVGTFFGIFTLIRWFDEQVKDNFVSLP